MLGPTLKFYFDVFLQDMFAAGTDTSSAAIEWTMAELIRNPRAMEILQNEVRQVVKNEEDINEDDIEKMPYLKGVIKESLRQHSPVPLLVPRESTRDTRVMGYDVVSGTQVIINAWSIARDPLLWENPQHFKPERFLGSSIDFKGFHFEYIPSQEGDHLKLQFKNATASQPKLQTTTIRENKRE